MLRSTEAAVIGISSAKGGVGKTTLVANLGCALAQISKGDVLLVDANFHASNLALHFGISRAPVVLQDVILGKKEVEEALVPLGGKLWILPSATLFFREIWKDLDLTRTQQMFKKLKRHYHTILLDTIAGSGLEAMSALNICDKVIAVSTPHLPAVSATLWTIFIAKRLNVPIMGLVLNRCRGKRYELTPAEIQKETGVPILGCIPDDEFVLEEVRNGVPVVRSGEKSPAAEEIVKLAKRLQTNLVPL
jgi:septum site-determining protein MinD